MAMKIAQEKQAVDALNSLLDKGGLNA